MQKLIQGIHRFQESDFIPLQGLFETLAKAGPVIRRGLGLQSGPGRRR